MSPTAPTRPHVVILVENLPARRDPRVWRECRALADAGFEVTAISPRGPMDPALTERDVDGIHLVSYPAPPPSESPVDFAREYAWSLAHMTRALARVARRRPIDVIQACNPPDVLFLVALPYRLAGIPFVFDHHDLSPEVYEERFGTDRGIVPALLRLSERATFATASRVISTNESYRAVALGRGRQRPAHVVVVRNGPDDAQLEAAAARPELRNGAAHLCVWFGTMGPQDGVDLALQAAAHLVHVMGRTDCHFAFVGQGDARDDMQRLAKELDLVECTSFPGWVEWDDALAYLATADLGLCPDPKGPLNDVSTMNKTMDYMAAGLPVVAFDLVETRVSAGAAAVYARPNDPTHFAAEIADLLDDPARRERMGGIGRERVRNELGWRHQRGRYVALYRDLVGRGTRRRRQRGLALAAKRTIDVVLAGLALAAAAPLLVVAAIAIKLDSRGPVFYRGERVGRDGRRFMIYKLRSMRADADDDAHRELVTRLLSTPDDEHALDVYKVDGDPRVTRVGRVLRRTSIDELPQLINVLRGEMSLVGPRPEVPYALDAYEPWHHERFDVLPGMTGLWQVSGRSQLSPAEMLALDVRYAREWSPASDLQILARTPSAVLPGRASAQ